MISVVLAADLVRHEPEVKDGNIVGCKGCLWQYAGWRTQTGWYQYLQHLEPFRDEQYCPLNDKDIEELQAMTRACNAPERKFED